MRQLGFDFLTSPERKAAEATRHSSHPKPATPASRSTTTVREPVDQDERGTPATPSAPSATAGAASEPPRGRHGAAFDLGERLTRLMGTRVEVVATDNKRVMLSSRVKPGRLQLRLHHMFLDADDEVVEAIARYLKRKSRRDGATIDAYIAANYHRIDERPRRRLRLRPQGRVHDLRAILDELRPLFEEDMSGLRITWGRKPTTRRGQRSLQLGAYSARDALIRIHPVLDQNWVPRWYVATVVFHEMLHHALPAQEVGGARRHHTRKFRQRERAYVDHAAARAWEEANLPRLLASIRTLPR